MFGIIGLCIIILNLFICKKKPWYSLLFYTGFSLVSPEMKFGGFSVSYGILAFFPVVCYYVARIKSIVFPNLLLLVVLFFFQVLFSTIYSCFFDGYIPNLIGVFAIFRFVVLMVCISDVRMLHVDAVKRVFFIIVLINFFAVLIQILIPESVKLFYDLYWKPSITPLETALELGRFTRAVGTFATPTILGAFSLITFSIFYFDTRHVKFTYWGGGGIVMSLVCGLAALSKIFILGVPILLLLEIVMCVLNCKKDSVFRIRVSFRMVLLVSFLIITGYVVIVSLIENNVPILWYLDYILKPEDALNTRYAVSGNLMDLKCSIENNIFIGIGEVIREGIFVGDSSFLIILYTVGIIGFILFFSFFLILLKESFKLGKRGFSCFFVLLSLLLAFMGANLFISPLGLMVFVYAISFFRGKFKSVSIVWNDKFYLSKKLI